MPRRKKMLQSSSEAKGTHTPAHEGALRILIISADARASARIARNISNLLPAAACEQARSLRAARQSAAESAPDLAIIDDELPDGSGFDLAAELAAPGACAIMMITDDPTFDLAMRALRAGAADMLPRTMALAGGDPLAAAIGRALQRTTPLRRRDQRIERLTHICRKLSDARQEVSSHVAGLCGDMIGAFQELADQVENITIAAEFKGLIRQELDVETLLRTALEYVLAKCGSTNAAVFLPSGDGDYSLGAYVNYDCPKEALDMMLEHLAGIIAPRMEDCPEMRLLPGEGELADFLGDDAHWLADCGAVTFACRDGDETHAVVILFRDRRVPFSAAALTTLKTIAPLFGQQLSRIVRIHHRHLPKEQWGIWGGMGLADEGDDDLDLAA